MPDQPSSTFHIRVGSSRLSGDFEVHFFADETNLIDFFGDGNVGLDPWDILKDNSQLRVQSSPHEALIGLCGCGCQGCGDLEVEIRGEGDQVVWTDPYAPKQVRFSASQYAAEIERALTDHSWETPARTAERLIGAGIERGTLAKNGFDFRWASARCRDGFMTLSFMLSPGPYQVLVKVPWNGEDINEIVHGIHHLLLQPPQSWPGIEYYPQGRNLPSPPFFA